MIAVPAGTGADCTTDSCPHHSDTDLAVFAGSTWLVHRTALSSVPGPNSSLRVYRSVDGGFTLSAILLPPTGRDIRAPHFFVTSTELRVLAIARLPVVSPRNASTDSHTVITRSSDGVTWGPFVDAAPATWSLWRPRARDGGYSTAGVQDGALAVQRFDSSDGLTFSPAALLPLDAGDTPLDTELAPDPPLMLVPLGGLDAELEGDTGRLRTALCTDSSCTELSGERLDTAVTFSFSGRSFAVARHHTLGSPEKRTALFELDAGIVLLGTLPSACDTGAAGLLFTGSSSAQLSWYSSPLSVDAGWAACRLGPTDIWVGRLALDRL
jgi:hypothetical protein